MLQKHHSVNNALTVSKHCWNQQGTTIILFFPWIWDILNWKKSLLVWFVILRLFVNSLTADNKFSPLQFAHFDTNSNAIISKTKHILWIFYCSSEMCMKFRKFWIESWESYLNYFKNYILRKSSLLKRLKILLQTPFSKQRFNVSKHCWNQQGTTIILFFHEFGIYWIGKKFLLVWFVILRLFVNSLTADNKYSRCNLHIFTQIQTPLSLKQKTFCPFFIAVLKCASNLEHFEYKVEYLSLIIFEIIYSERAHYLNV